MPSIIYHGAAPASTQTRIVAFTACRRHDVDDVKKTGAEVVNRGSRVRRVLAARGGFTARVHRSSGVPETKPGVAVGRQPRRGISSRRAASRDAVRPHRTPCASRRRHFKVVYGPNSAKAAALAACRTAGNAHFPFFSQSFSAEVFCLLHKSSTEL